MNAPTGLMIELLTRPGDAVVTNPTPVFSWIVNDPRPAAAQSAWQILVTSSRLRAGDGDCWDSGKVDSADSTGVRYAGKPLSPSSEYKWKVRVWDREGLASEFSEPQCFRTGDFGEGGRRWPGESRLVEVSEGEGADWVFEDRHAARYREIPPASVVRNEAGNLFVTFERAAFATLKLRLKEVAERRTLVVHLGESKRENRQVDREPGGSITYKRQALEIEPGRTEYVLSLPRQVSHYPNSQVLPEHMPEVTAFRFAEIENPPAELAEAGVRQLALLYPFDDDAAGFASSDPKLDAVWELCKHTLKVTPFMGLYVDGARERMPYEADAYIQQISHYCVDREYAIARCTAQFLIYNPSWPTEWHLHLVPMAWADYLQTANPDFLKRNYRELQAKTLLPLAREDGLISTRTGLVTEEFLESIHYKGKSFRDIVDWPQGTPADVEQNRSGHGSERIEGETDRFVFSDYNTVVNAFHYQNLVLMARIARLVGREDDGAWYEDRAAMVKESFNKALLDPHTGQYTDGEGVEHSSLHANFFPVVFGLAPSEYHAPILEFIKSRGMACSPYGAVYLLEAIYALGDAEYALELLTAEHDRSWMNMIRIGSTMTTEAWDMKYKKNMTWNHAWGASPAYIITRMLMGVEPLEPAFRRIQIKPRPGWLRHARLKTPTIRGPVSVSFVHEPGNSFGLDVEIPANTTARVAVPRPHSQATAVSVNARPADVRLEEGYLVIDRLPAGHHWIVVR